MLPNPNIDIKLRFVSKPRLLFRDSNSYPSPYGILKFGPYIPASNPVTIDIWIIKEHISPEYLEKVIDAWEDILKSPLTISHITSDFNTFKDLLGKPYVINGKKKVSFLNFSDQIGNSESSLIFIIHKGKIPEDSYVRAKIKAKSFNKRIQFLDLSHINKDKPYTLLNIFVQSLAKFGGTPWKVDNSIPSSFQGKDTLIVGNAFSTLKGRPTYSVSHFLDIMNLKQVIKVRATTLRKEDFKGLHLTSDEMKELLEGSIKWYYNQNSSSGNLNLFLYRSTPLHPEEEVAINETVEDSAKQGKVLNITHLHVSKNKPLMRLYDSDNYSLQTRFQYMGKQGQVLEMLLKDMPEGNKLKFVGYIIILTTGLVSIETNNRISGPRGTPVPLTLEIHSNSSFNPALVENQVMAMTSADWEYMGNQYNEPFILKYAYRLAQYLSIWGRVDFPEEWDIRDVM